MFSVFQINVEIWMFHRDLIPQSRLGCVEGRRLGPHTHQENLGRIQPHGVYWALVPGLGPCSSNHKSMWSGFPAFKGDNYGRSGEQDQTTLDKMGNWGGGWGCDRKLESLRREGWMSRLFWGLWFWRPCLGTQERTVSCRVTVMCQAWCWVSYSL